MSAILLYHSVADNVVDDELQVRRQTLLRHVEWCVELGYELVSLAEALDTPRSKQVAVTFDDGFANFLLAWPELRRRGIRPTVFLCPAMAGRVNAWASPGRVRERLLAAVQVRGLGEAGVSFGCHGWNHRAFEGRKPAELAEDLARCDAWFRDTLGERPWSFAWPFGRFDETAIAVVGRRYRHALAVTPPWGAEISSLCIPRVQGTERLTLEALAEDLELWSLPPAAMTPDLASPGASGIMPGIRTV